MKFPDFIDGQAVMAKVRYKSRPGLAHLYHVDVSEFPSRDVQLERSQANVEGGDNSSFLIPHSSLVRIVFENDIESITPGQSVVFYCGDNYTDVLGGAILL